MPKILFIIDNISSLGGIEKITTLLANELVTNYKISILNVNNKNNNTPKYKLDKEISILNLKRNNKIFQLFEASKIIKKAKIKYVIVQAKNLYYFTYLHYLVKAKIIFVDHDSIKAYPTTQINENRPRMRASKAADVVVSLTEENKNEYIRRFRVSYNKIIVIPNFIDIETKHVKYNSESKTIVAVGRYHVQKRFDLLINSFALISNKYPDWNIEIFGEGSLRTQLQQLINEKSLADRITLCGEFKNREEAYLNKAFLCMTSQHEGFGLVLLEGFAYKLPAISFSCPSGPSEVINNGKNGYLIDNYDVLRFANAIETLIKDKELRKTFSKNTEKGLQNFNKDLIIKKWKELIQ